MSLIESIARLFFKNHESVSSSETFSFGEWRIEGGPSQVPDSGSLLKLASELPERDKLVVSFALDSDPIAFNSAAPENVEPFLSGCRDVIQVAAEGSRATLTIAITKSFHQNAVTLYSVSTLSRTLSNKKLRERLKIFDDCANGETSIWVQMLENSPPFQTRTINFSGTQPAELRATRRNELRTKRNDFCHSEYASFAFIPEDFYLLTRSPNQEFNILMDELCVSAAFLYLADISARDQNAVDAIVFKLNGYKAIGGEFCVTRPSSQAVQTWYAIYEWVYSAGGVSDKLGLARNIMSLHWRGSVSDFAEPGVLTSIRSSYEIYLKANVKQYIEVKNKLNEYLTEYSGKTAKLGDELAGKFEKSVTAFVSFFITSILAKVLTDASFTGVFNRPVAIIGFAIVAGSSLHLCLSLYVLKKDRERLASDWDILERRYADLLDKVDLGRIFDKSTGFTQASQNLTAKRNLFLIVWIVLLLVASAALTCFTDWKVSPKHPKPPTSSSNSTNAVP